MVEYIIDSYAWVEYFLGSSKGEILKQLFDKETNDFHTIECCLAELKSWTIKNEIDFKTIYDVIKKNSAIAQISKEDWIQAAIEKHEQRKTQKDFGLIDSVILAKQKKMNCKVISGDKHFKKIKNVIFMN